MSFSFKLSRPCPLNAYYRAVGYRLVPTKRARTARDIIADEVCLACGGKPEPLIGPLSLKVEVTPTAHKNTSPVDIDAYLKGLLDAFTSVGVWGDDKQVKELQVSMNPPSGKGWLDVEVWEI